MSRTAAHLQRNSGHLRRVVVSARGVSSAPHISEGDSVHDSQQGLESAGQDVPSPGVGSKKSKGVGATAACRRPRQSSVGLVLIDSSYTPIYANSQAIRILLYLTRARKTKPLKTLLAEKLRSMLFPDRSPAQCECLKYITSGKRSYRCRVIYLTSRSNEFIQPHAALLLERITRRVVDTSLLAALYHVTPRERESVELLIQGLTNKEIGARLQISPNTVRAFLRTTMMKMGVSTRSGIVGKILEKATS